MDSVKKPEKEPETPHVDTKASRCTIHTIQLYSLFQMPPAGLAP